MESLRRFYDSRDGVTFNCIVLPELRDVIEQDAMGVDRTDDGRK